MVVEITRDIPQSTHCIFRPEATCPSKCALRHRAEELQKAATQEGSASKLTFENAWQYFRGTGQNSPQLQHCKNFRDHTAATSKH